MKLLLIWVLALAPGMAYGQSPAAAAPAEEAPLNKPVTLDANHVTLNTVLLQLSSQLGVRVVVGAGLDERVLSAHFRQAPARTVLDALCEMYHWRWLRAEGGGYVIDRPSVGSPTTLVELSASLRQSLPVDARRSLLLDQPDDVVLRELAAMDRSTDLYLRTATAIGPSERLSPMQQEDLDTLLDHLKAKAGDRAAIPVAAFSAEDRRLLVRVLYYHTLMRGGYLPFGATAAEYDNHGNEPVTWVAGRDFWFTPAYSSGAFATGHSPWRGSAGVPWPYGGGMMTSGYWH